MKTVVHIQLPSLNGAEINCQTLHRESPPNLRTCKNNVGQYVFHLCAGDEASLMTACASSMLRRMTCRYGLSSNNHGNWPGPSVSYPFHRRHLVSPTIDRLPLTKPSRENEVWAVEGMCYFKPPFTNDIRIYRIALRSKRFPHNNGLDSSKIH